MLTNHVEDWCLITVTPLLTYRDLSIHRNSPSIRSSSPDGLSVDKKTFDLIVQGRRKGYEGGLVKQTKRPCQIVASMETNLKRNAELQQKK